MEGGLEVYLSVVRPKVSLSTHRDEFSPVYYDILLLETMGLGGHRHSSGGGENSVEQQKLLPKIMVPYDAEPGERAVEYLDLLTGGDRGGIKALRSVFIPASSKELDVHRKALSKAALFALIVDPSDKLSQSYVDSNRSQPGFYDLSFVLESNSTPGNTTFAKSTTIMLHRLRYWMEQKNSQPGFLDALLRKSAENRLQVAVDNPAYVTKNRPIHRVFSTSAQGGVVESENRSSSPPPPRCTPNESFTKMMAIEKCDKAVMNPLFGSGLPYKPKVDAYSINIFWGRGKPDMNQIRLVPATMLNKSSEWGAKFHLHKLAFEGSASQIKQAISQGYSAGERDHYSWTPLHYASWFGHVEACRALIEDGQCSPNISTANEGLAVVPGSGQRHEGSTALHLAALNGRMHVLHYLLSLKDIDVNKLNRDKKSPLNLCEKGKKENFVRCKELLLKAMDRPYQPIEVHVMDSAKPVRSLSLVSDEKTSVLQLHQQMMKELQLPKSCEHYFTIWVCSPNLQLQLKREHQPIIHLQTWRDVVPRLSDFPPETEKPRLIWKRDVRLSVNSEKDVKNVNAIKLLFREAYDNYIQAMYPCDEMDALRLAAFLMQLNLGEFDPRTAKSYLANEDNLLTLVPAKLLKNVRTREWPSKIQRQYKNLSSQVQHMLDSNPQIPMNQVTSQLQLQFLTVCWNLIAYGSAFFSGYLFQPNRPSRQQPVHIGVNDIGLHVIGKDTKTMLHSSNYPLMDYSVNTTGTEKSLEIRDRKNGKTIHLRTKQADLINSLMRRLSSPTAA